jgi:hypothetical protein
MRKILMTAVLGTLALTVSCFAQNPPPAAPEPAAPVAVKPMHHEHHPEIMRAIRKLRGAKRDLQNAAHDFGGHKQKAIMAIDAALAELHSALSYDRQ